MYILILLVFPVGCAEETEYPWPLGESSCIQADISAKVSLQHDNASLTSTGATFHVFNQSGDKISFDYMSYHLEVFSQNEWQEILLVRDIPMEYIVLADGENDTFSLKWVEYGTLPSGIYRILIPFETNQRENWMECVFCLE